ncbi:hypothetical protein BKA70DRAFT_1214179 [Coprinopsis sp. MPI-PUGE-AT-0042]|nr:hypothetical protein BKA70DRAFT_1214179 [Coprinopsis sp. MPI-PUGE-AT-0042]
MLAFATGMSAEHGLNLTMIADPRILLAQIAIQHAAGASFSPSAGLEVARITWKLQHSIHLADAVNIVPKFLALHSAEVHRRERLFRLRNDSLVTLPDFHTAILSEYEDVEVETNDTNLTLSEVLEETKETKVHYFFFKIQPCPGPARNLEQGEEFSKTHNLPYLRSRWWIEGDEGKIWHWEGMEYGDAEAGEGALPPTHALMDIVDSVGGQGGTRQTLYMSGTHRRSCSKTANFGRTADFPFEQAGELTVVETTRDGSSVDGIDRWVYATKLRNLVARKVAKLPQSPSPSASPNPLHPPPSLPTTDSLRHNLASPTPILIQRGTTRLLSSGPHTGRHSADYAMLPRGHPTQPADLIK